MTDAPEGLSAAPEADNGIEGEHVIDTNEQRISVVGYLEGSI